MVEREKSGGDPGTGTGVGAGRKENPASFTRVRDSRGRPIPSLWVRRGRYYARLNVGGSDRRIPLTADNVKDARIELRKAQVDAATSKESTEQGGTVPTVSEFMDRYLAHAELTKRMGTAKLERIHLERFRQGRGSFLLDAIAKPVLLGYRAERLAAGWSRRTCNLAVTVVRNMLKHAVDVGVIQDLPCPSIPSLKHIPKRKRLYSRDEIDRLCATAKAEVRNGRALADYIRLLALSGARRDEGLRLAWSDVDFERGLLIIGSDGLAKNHDSRSVDLHPALCRHLRDMYERRNIDSPWLFPGRQPERHVRTFMEALRSAREKVGDTTFGFHHCRVFFASQCVMAGIDFRTIASWLGHRDGGVLLSKVYARLSDEHKRRAAAKLTLG